MVKITLIGRPSHPLKKILIFVVILAVIGVGSALYISHRGSNSNETICNEFSQSNPGPLDEPPAVCLPGFNTPRVSVDGPSQIDIDAGKSKTVTLKITNNREITRVYGFSVTAHGVRVSGLPQDITVDSGKTKSVKITVTAVAQDQSASFFQIDVAPVGGDRSDATTQNTEVTVK